MKASPTALLAAATLLVANASAAEIFRCVAAGGAVTYQEFACPDSSRPERTSIPTEFPPLNLAERDRLFEREAALHRRLEARRDRELQEAQMREARAEREAERDRLAALIAAQAAQPQYVLAYPRVPHHWPLGQRRAAPPFAMRNQSILR